MSYVSQDQLEDALLFRLFDFAQDDGRHVKVEVLTKILNDVFSTRRIDMAVSALVTKRLVDARYNTMSGTSYSISEIGYRRIESALVDGEEFFINFQAGGEEWLIGGDQPTLVPSADGLVSINHNAPEYAETIERFDEVIEAFRGYNGPDIEPDAKSRAVASLQAARELWNATELKVLQLQVGVKMVIDDVAPLAKGKAMDAAFQVLFSLLRAFIKTHLGFDWEQL